MSVFIASRETSRSCPRARFAPNAANLSLGTTIFLFLVMLRLKGRCRECGKSIGIRYPLVELTTAIFFAGTVAHFGWNLNGFKWCLFQAIMTVLFWVDLEERILPDEFTLGGSALGLVFAFFTKVPGDLGELLFPTAGNARSIFVRSARRRVHSYLAARRCWPDLGQSHQTRSPWV